MINYYYYELEKRVRVAKTLHAVLARSGSTVQRSLWK